MDERNEKKEDYEEIILYLGRTTWHNNGPNNRVSAQCDVLESHVLSQYITTTYDCN